MDDACLGSAAFVERCVQLDGNSPFGQLDQKSTLDHAATVGHGTVCSEVGKDLLLQLGHRIQNRGHRSKLASMSVGNRRNREIQQPTVRGAHEDSLPLLWQGVQKADQRT